MKLVNVIIVGFSFALSLNGCDKEESKVWTWEVETNTAEGKLFYETGGPETVVFPDSGVLRIIGSKVSLEFSTDFDSAASGQPEHVEIAFVSEDANPRVEKGSLSLSAFGSSGFVGCSTMYSGLDYVPSQSYVATFSYDMKLGVDKSWSSDSVGEVSGNALLRAELSSGERMLFRIKRLRVVVN